MTASAEAAPAPAAVDVLEALPPALASMRRSLALGYAAEPSLLVVSLALTLLAAAPDALFALWLAMLANGVLSADRTAALTAAVGLGGSAAASWFLRVLSGRLTRRFRDRVTVALEAHVAELQATVATVEHHERPEYLDRLSILRNQVFVLDHMFMSLFSTCGWLLRLAITLALLVSVHPALILLALCALPTVIASSIRPDVERSAEERGGRHARLARHLFVTMTTAAPAKEVRVARLGEALAKERHEAWLRWYAPIASARLATAAWQCLAWSVFGLGFVGAIAFVATRANAQPGAVLLVLAAGSRLSSYVGATVGEIGFLRGIWLDGSKRLTWLERFVAARKLGADAEVPARLQRGIRFDHVSFSYPGTTRRVLEDVSLELPKGAVVALVGENGAGKSTLVKLLCKLYEPSAGRILLDDVPLARVPADAYRERVAGAFQDFFRFELAARHSVGLGDLPHYDDPLAVSAAVTRAGADDVIERLKDGLDTQLGPSWPDGVDVSFGQWQKLALARGFMRPSPLLLVLDEPTAALDAETEHALFERYASAARGTRAGGDATITLLVSHRFSTVRMADLIVVLDGAHVVEVGSHDALLQKRGRYAELYGIQAQGYR
jgi:ATP-binding cassette subfamily B protein